MSEVADSKLTQSQIEAFRTLRREMSSALPRAHFHLSNSGGIWNQKDLVSGGWKNLTDVVRPGLSLYGVPPWKGAPARGIEPVLTLEASVIQVHRLKAGDCVGYGGTYRVTGNDATHVATLAAGYADGLKRNLSNTGNAWLGNSATSFVGIVSMDLSAVRCTASTQVGDRVEILGPHVDPWGQAQAAGTIPYELLTSLSGRVQRIYE
jgi:alanine racemase